MVSAICALVGGRARLDPMFEGLIKAVIAIFPTVFAVLEQVLKGPDQAAQERLGIIEMGGAMRVGCQGRVPGYWRR